MAKCLLNALINPKEVEATLSLCGGTESTYITVVVDVGPFGSVGCVARVPSMARLSAQSSTNQLALSPGSPARPPNSGDEVRFILHSCMGVVLPDRLLSATCRSSFRYDKSACKAYQSWEKPWSDMARLVLVMARLGLH